MKMRKVFLVLIIAFVLYIPSVFAKHECFYAYKKDSKTADVTITYSESKNEVIVDGKEISNLLKKFRKAWGAINLGYEYEEADVSSPLLTESIGYALENDACPGDADEVYVCAGTVSSISVPVAQQIFGAGEFLATLVSPIWEEYDSFWDYLQSLGDSVTEIFQGKSVKEVLIVSGSQADAKDSYGYVEDGSWFDIDWSGFYDSDEDMDFSVYSSSTIECDTVYYIGDKKRFDLNCPNLSKLMGAFEDEIDVYSACQDNGECRINALEDIKVSEENLKKYCVSILENQDYYLIEGKANSCISECLTIKEKVITKKESVGLITSENSNDCGFSARLLVLLGNILKWIKYILPVVVIILGMLDFIKAIGSEKEDEMKKAQKGFVTRLIAAALVFIIPLIIEFILIKMGFTYDSCSLF